MTAATSPRLLSLSEVRTRTGLGRTTIYRWMNEGRFPAAIKLSDKCTRWSEADLDAWIQSKAA